MIRPSAILRHLEQRLPDFEANGSPELLKGGLVNYVWRVDGHPKPVIVKSAPPYVAAVPEIALIGGHEQVMPVLQVVRAAYRPFQVVAAGKETADHTIALLAHRPQVDGKATAYVCRRFLCQAPVTEPEELVSQLDQQG